MPPSKRAVEKSDLDEIQYDVKRQRRDEGRVRRQNLDAWLTQMLQRTGVTRDQCRMLFTAAKHTRAFKEMLIPSETPIDTTGYKLDRLQYITDVMNEARTKLLTEIRHSLPDCTRPAWLKLLVVTMPSAYTALAIETTLRNMTTVTKTLAVLPIESHAQMSALIEQYAKPTLSEAIDVVLDITRQKTAQQICDDMFRQLIRCAATFTVRIKAVEPQKQLQRTTRSQSRVSKTPRRIWIGDALHTVWSYDTDIVVRVMINETVGVIVRVKHIEGGIKQGDLLTILQRNASITKYAGDLGINKHEQAFRGMLNPNDLDVYACDKYKSKLYSKLHLQLVRRQTPELMLRACVHRTVQLLLGDEESLERWTDGVNTVYNMLTVSEVMDKVRQRCEFGLTGGVIEFNVNKSQWRELRIAEDEEQSLIKTEQLLTDKQTASLFDPFGSKANTMHIKVCYVWNVIAVCDKCRHDCIFSNPITIVRRRKKGHMVYIGALDAYICCPDELE